MTRIEAQKVPHAKTKLTFGIIATSSSLRLKSFKGCESIDIILEEEFPSKVLTPEAIIDYIIDINFKRVKMEPDEQHTVNMLELVPITNPACSNPVTQAVLLSGCPPTR